MLPNLSSEMTSMLQRVVALRLSGCLNFQIFSLGFYKSTADSTISTAKPKKDRRGAKRSKGFGLLQQKRDRTDLCDKIWQRDDWPACL